MSPQGRVTLSRKELDALEGSALLGYVAFEYGFVEEGGAWRFAVHNPRPVNGNAKAELMKALREDLNFRDENAVPLGVRREWVVGVSDIGALPKTLANLDDVSALPAITFDPHLPSRSLCPFGGRVRGSCCCWIVRFGG
jgi:hypothetical protein